MFSHRGDSDPTGKRELQRGYRTPTPQQRRNAYHPSRNQSSREPIPSHRMDGHIEEDDERTANEGYVQEAERPPPPKLASSTASPPMEDATSVSGSYENREISRPSSTVPSDDSVITGGTSAATNPSAEHVRVVVRARPRIRGTWYQDHHHRKGGSPTASEAVGRESIRDVISVDKDTSTIILEMPVEHESAAKEGQKKSVDPPRPKTFRYDEVFDANSTQAEVYSNIGPSFVENMLNGYNCSIFAYGQTGSGKTYTMLGPADGTVLPEPNNRSEDSDSSERIPSLNLPSVAGFIPRMLYDLFTRIGMRKDNSANQGSVANQVQEFHRIEVSYVEIYCERLRDLLSSDPSRSKGRRATHETNGDAISKTHPLKLRESPEKGVFVEGATVHAVSNYRDVFDLLRDGNAVRAVAATRMNNLSSRSHAILTLQYTKTTLNRRAQTAHDRRSLVHLVDLAGSERVRKSGAAGTRLKETGSINKSLLHLGIVIRKLAQKDKHPSSQQGASDNISTRSSVLTQLLRQSLGGNSKTAMIANVAPENVHTDETLSTLRYASDAKHIVNHAVVNEDPNVSLIRQLKGEIENLRYALEEATRRAEMAEARAHHSTTSPSVPDQSAKQSTDPMNAMITEWNEKVEQTRKEATARRENLLKISADEKEDETDEETDNTGDSMEAGDEHIELLHHRGTGRSPRKRRSSVVNDDVALSWFNQLKQLAVSSSRNRLYQELAAADNVADNFNHYASLLLVPLRAIPTLVARPAEVLDQYFAANRISARQSVVHALDESFDSGALRSLTWEEITSLYDNYPGEQGLRRTGLSSQRLVHQAKSDQMTTGILAQEEDSEDSSFMSHHQVGVLLVNCYSGVERGLKQTDMLTELERELPQLYERLLLQDHVHIPFGLHDFSNPQSEFTNGHSWLGTTKLALIGLTKGKKVRVRVPLVREEMLRKHDESSGGKRQHRHTVFIGKVETELEISEQPLLGSKLEVSITPKQIFIDRLQGAMGQKVDLAFLSSVILLFSLPRPLRSVSSDNCFHAFRSYEEQLEQKRFTAKLYCDSPSYSKARSASWSLMMSEEGIQALKEEDMMVHLFGSFEEPSYSSQSVDSLSGLRSRAEVWMPLALRLSGVTSHDLVKQTIADSCHRFHRLLRMNHYLTAEGHIEPPALPDSASSSGVCMAIDLLSTVGQRKDWDPFPVHKERICEIPSLDPIIGDQASRGVDILRLGNVMHSVGYEPQFRLKPKELQQRNIFLSVLIKEYNSVRTQPFGRDARERKWNDFVIESCLDVSVSDPGLASKDDVAKCMFYSCKDPEALREVKSWTLAVTATPPEAWQQRFAEKVRNSHNAVIGFVVRIKLSLRHAYQPVELAHLIVARTDGSFVRHRDVSEARVPAWHKVPHGASEGCVPAPHKAAYGVSLLQMANVERLALLSSCYLSTLHREDIHSEEGSNQSRVEDLLLWHRVQNSRLFVAVNSISYSQQKKEGLKDRLQELTSRQQSADNVAPAPKAASTTYSITVDLDSNIISGFLHKLKGQARPPDSVRKQAEEHFEKFYERFANADHDSYESREIEFPQQVREEEKEEENSQSVAGGSDTVEFPPDEGMVDSLVMDGEGNASDDTPHGTSSTQRSNNKSFSLRRAVSSIIRNDWAKRWFVLHGPFMMYFPSSTDVEERKNPRGVIVVDKSVSVVIPLDSEFSDTHNEPAEFPENRRSRQRHRHRRAHHNEASVSDANSVVSVSLDRPSVFAKAVSVTRSRPQSVLGGRSVHQTDSSESIRKTLSRDDMESHLSFYVGFAWWNKSAQEIKWWQLKAPELYDKPRWVRALKAQSHIITEESCANSPFSQ
eukprot:gb/GECG01008387.1/.p1 GENE.gb/GECG01008387.1/~~gb/GECG01008387.1/.p1  ORF type:complete len:1832 (+),score=231.84 gb/GECG01008387.1/:1-5496(+)